MNFKLSHTWDYETQRSFWNTWDARHLSEETLGDEARRRGDVALSLVQKCGLNRPRIIEFGCGNGWLAERLASLGSVTGVDIADQVLEEARQRVPGGTFLAGDALSMDLPAEEFDLAVTLEMLAQVPDQSRFVDVLARSLRKDGYLVLITQNRTVYGRRDDIVPVVPGQYRHWLTMRELRRLLHGHFYVQRAFTFEPAGHRSFLRIVNSPRLNGLAAHLVPQNNLNHLKELLGLGQSLVVLARKRPA